MYCDACGKYGHKPHCKGSMLALLGALIIINEYALAINWWLFFGGLIFLKGIAIMLIGDRCACHKNCGDGEDKPAKKK